jgi:hypothetical protein
LKKNHTEILEIMISVSQIKYSWER